ncbi:MAG TPA: hypothetical protein VF651_02425 [Gammaproteobacteria bacterium]
MNGFIASRPLLALLLLAVLAPAWAATPASGTLTDTSGPLDYVAGPFVLANPTPVPLVDAGPECSNPQQPCDDFALTVTLPSDYTTTHPGVLLRVSATWSDAGAGASDYDLYVYAGSVTNTDGSVAAQAQSASSSDPEVATLRTFNGSKTFTIKVVPYTPSGETVQVHVELVQGPAGGGGSAFGQATPTAPGVPRYQNFYAPDGSTAQGDSGEFSIGFNPKSRNVLTLSDLDTFRVTPPESRQPPLPESGPALWTKVSPSIVSLTTLDPILYTDPATGRSFESMQTTGAEALFAYSDDDGATWVQASAAPPNGAADHETIGAGPYPATLPVPNPLYPHAVYYCSQAVIGPALCQRSDTGGSTFGPGVPIYFGNGITACSGLHGHVKVGPDGAVYVPAADCGGQQGGSVSQDAGVTWTQFLVPASQSFTGGSTDPSLAVDQDNTLYYCYVDGQGPEHHVHAAVSHDHGKTFAHDTDLGTAVGVVNAVFPEAVAGSAGRAACGFLGTDTAGDHESLDFPGSWYLFIATTYDGGATWTTVNATPGDPVQGAGGIWNGGGSRQNRNLLDFNEVTMDDRGRVLFGYDDGCVSDACITDPSHNDFTAYQRVARQIGGKPLLAQFDPAEPAPPKAPYLEGTRSANQATLTWTPPDNGGAGIRAYRILRGTAAGGEKEVAKVGGDKTSYIDARARSSVAQYYYKVVAVNPQGAGAASNEIVLQVQNGVADHCTVPGINVLTDAAGDNTGTAGTDLKSLEIAEPYAADGVIRLRFQLDTDPGSAVPPPGSYWYASFKEADGKVHGVRMVFPVGSLSPSFESYVAAPNSSGVTDGRFVQAGSSKPAESGSFYDFGTGTIVLIAKAADLGLAAGASINGFNSAVVLPASTPAGGVATTLDQMPNSLAYASGFTLSPNSACQP